MSSTGNMKEAVDLAFQVHQNLGKLGLTHKKITDTLGCGSTLVSMYVGGARKDGASKITLYVLNSLADIEFMKAMTGWYVQNAKKEIPTLESLLQKYGKRRIVRLFGVAPSTINRWKKDINFFWDEGLPTRISIAGLRILAIKMAAKVSKSKEPELELFPEEEQSIEPEKTEPGIGQSLRDMAEVTETVFLDVHDKSDMVDLLGKMKDIIRNSARIRQRELEKELARMKSLGI